jgi:hypothetical protein
MDRYLQLKLTCIFFLSLLVDLLTLNVKHDTSHPDPEHSHHNHHHHHHHNHYGHGHDPLLDDQTAYPPPSYGSVINERDGWRAFGIGDERGYKKRLSLWN